MQNITPAFKRKGFNDGRDKLMLLGWLVPSMRRGQGVNEDSEGEKQVSGMGIKACVSPVTYLYSNSFICVSGNMQLREGRAASPCRCWGLSALSVREWRSAGWWWCTMVLMRWQGHTWNHMQTQARVSHIIQIKFLHHYYKLCKMLANVCWGKFILTSYINQIRAGLWSRSLVKKKKKWIIEN